MTAIARVIVTCSNKLIEETEFEDINEFGIRKAARDLIKQYNDEHEISVKIELIYLDKQYGQAVKSEYVD